MILPILGAPGVAAHEVKKRSGFWVEYGPVRAADLPEYLKTHTASPEMRKVAFPLRDRLVLRLARRSFASDASSCSIGATPTTCRSRTRR